MITAKGQTLENKMESKEGSSSGSGSQATALFNPAPETGAKERAETKKCNGCDYIGAIEKWNEFCRHNALQPFPRPGSEQMTLKKAYLEAIKYFEFLPERDGIVIDPSTGDRYKYEHYRKEE